MSMVCTPLLKELGCDSNLLAWSLLLELCAVKSEKIVLPVNRRLSVVAPDRPCLPG